MLLLALAVAAPGVHADRERDDQAELDANYSPGATGRVPALEDAWRGRERGVLEEARGASRKVDKLEPPQETSEVSVPEQLAEHAGRNASQPRTLQGALMFEVGHDISFDLARSLSQTMEQASNLSSQAAQFMDAHGASVQVAFAQMVRDCETDPRRYTANTTGIQKLLACIRSLEDFAKEARERRSESERLNNRYSTMMMNSVQKLYKFIDPKQISAKLQKKSLEDQQYASANLMKQVRQVKANMHTFMGDNPEGDHGYVESLNARQLAH